MFLGSPPFAVPSLDALVDAGHAVTLVVSQPDHPAGRGRRLTPPPVAIRAAELGIPVFQPSRIRNPEARERLAIEAPDLIVVAAYGQILPKAVLDVPKLGCINVHPSLLPRHRGPSPISAALLEGDEVTGVSIMLMDEGMDTGPVLSSEATPIDPGDDQITLTERLSRMGARLLVETITEWTEGRINPVPQDPATATVSRLVSRSEGLLDWTEPAVALWRQIRAYAEWPQGYTFWNERKLTISASAYEEGLALEPGLVEPFGPRTRSPVAAAIGTGRGVLLPRVLGIEGRRPTQIDAFLRGHPAFTRARLTSPGQGDTASTEAESGNL